MANLTNMQNVKVKIVKAKESSGNIQFFVRAIRDHDNREHFLDALLEYQCFQTKHFDQEECIKRALFSARYLLRFFGKDPADLEFVQFSSEDMKIVEQDRLFWRT